MSDLSAALFLIREAIEEGAARLDLGGLGLEELPDLLSQATSITHLSVRGNRLTQLPDSIGNLANLVQISAADNHIVSLPETLDQCRELAHLNLRNNKLERLPESLFGLQKIESLQLMGNPLPLEEVVLGRWNRPDEILDAYRQKFPAPKPPPPPSFLVDQVTRYFPPETIRELAETLSVPAEIVDSRDHRTLTNQFIAYHVRHGLETELRDLLQAWVPHVDWHHPQYELESADNGHILS